MQPVKNSEGKRVCDISNDHSKVVIKVKGSETVIRAENNSKLIIENL